MELKIRDDILYSLSFADDQVICAADRDNEHYMCKFA